MTVNVKPLFTTGEVAEMLCVSIVKVRAMIDKGYLDGEKIGRNWYIPLSSLQARAAVWESILQAENVKKR